MEEHKLALLQGLARHGGYLAVSMSDAADPDFKALVEEKLVEVIQMDGHGRVASLSTQGVEYLRKFANDSKNRGR